MGPVRRLSWRMRATLWVRSCVLPDLSRLTPLERLLRWYTPHRVDAAWARLGAAEIIRLVDAHLAGYRRMRGRRCLRRGLLLFYLLRRGGHPAVLHFCAFRRPVGAALTHCWTTVDELTDDPPIDPCLILATWSGVEHEKAPDGHRIRRAG